MKSVIILNFCNEKVIFMVFYVKDVKTLVPREMEGYFNVSTPDKIAETIMKQVALEVFLKKHRSI